MNNKKLIYYIFIGFIFMGGLSNMFVGKDINQKTLGLFLIFLSILISPLFDKICGLIKSEFSVSKKTLLGIGLFFVFIVCLIIENFFASIFIMCTYWITIFYLKNKILKAKEAKQKKLEQEQAEREKKLEKAKAKRERFKQILKKIKLEKERLEKEQAERERLEQEILEKLKAKLKRLKQKLDKIKLEKERLEKEQTERERLKQEILEKLKAELKRLKQKLEKIKLEQERLEKEQVEHEKLEQERLEKLKAERRRRLEQERLEKEQAERERLKQEILEKLKAECRRLDQERLKKEQAERRERLEQERLEKLKAKRRKLKKERLKKLKAKLERLEQEKQIIKKFDNLDSFIGHVISELLIETNEKFKNIDESLYIKKDNILNIKNIIIDFCNDTRYFNSIYEFDNLFNNTSYYERKINKHFSSIKLYAENKILNSSFLETYKSKLILDYPRIIEDISNNIPKYSNNLLYKTIELEDKKRLYLDLDYNLYDSECENAFLYITYLMLIGTCISELIFIEEKIRALKPESEFYKIILGMEMELKDINSVIEKSKPIYDEYYKNDLGLIDSNSPLYDIAVNTIIRKINDEKELVKDILKITNTEDYTEKSFEKTINSWLYEVSKEYKFLDIEPYITYKILKSVSTSDFNSFLSILSKTNEYIQNYDNYIKRHKIMSDRQRYLNGDFLKEKMEIKMSNDLKDVTSGKEFELFLERLFKSLGYKTIHNGKSGDQGADLIIEKNNYVYAVQAKCYTNKVSNTPIQEVVASLKYYNANQGVVVTNSTFTQGAQDLAKVNNVILIDGKALNYLIDSVSDLNKNIDILQKLKNSY